MLSFVSYVRGIKTMWESGTCCINWNKFESIPFGRKEKGQHLLNEQTALGSGKTKLRFVSPKIPNNCIGKLELVSYFTRKFPIENGFGGDIIVSASSTKGMFSRKYGNSRVCSIANANVFICRGSNRYVGSKWRQTMRKTFQP